MRKVLGVLCILLGVSPLPIIMVNVMGWHEALNAFGYIAATFVFVGLAIVGIRLLED